MGLLSGWLATVCINIELFVEGRHPRGYQAKGRKSSQRLEQRRRLGYFGGTASEDDDGAMIERVSWFGEWRQGARCVLLGGNPLLRDSSG